MITISFGCTYLSDQCKETFTAPFEVFLSPDTMLLVGMRQATDSGWWFASSDPSRAMCPTHATDHKAGDVAQLRVFRQLHQVPGVHGLIMIGLEECLGGGLRVALGASRSPEPAGLVRLHRSDVRQVLGLVQDALVMTQPATEKR